MVYYRYSAIPPVAIYFEWDDAVLIVGYAELGKIIEGSIFYISEYAVKYTLWGFIRRRFVQLK